MNSVLVRHSILRAAAPLRSQPIYRSQLSALSRLLSTLAVLEQRDGKIQGSSLSAITAAQKLGGSVTAFVAGGGVKAGVAAEASKIKGVDKVLAVDNAAYDKVCHEFSRWGCCGVTFNRVLHAAVRMSCICANHVRTPTNIGLA